MFLKENDGDNTSEATPESVSLEQDPAATPSDAISHADDSPKTLSNIGFFYKDREISCSMIWRESFFFLALVLTTYGALYNAPPKISRQPIPVPFFERGSIVKDWYKGQLSTALTHMIKFEVSFVMYYAPWDAECQHARLEFEKAAYMMDPQVHFSAINCWSPGSECRMQHTKVPSWPVLMVYTSTSKSIMYKGPRNAESMVKFLQLILRPIHRISSHEELLYLLVDCETIAIGYTPLEQGSRMYNMFYSIALKIKESDPFGDLCFAVVTSEKTAIDMGVEYLPNIRLLQWNETLEYPSDFTITEENIMLWLRNSMLSPSVKVTLPWIKANSFQPFLEGGPTMIMFTPINPLYKHNGYYNMFRLAAMEYHNCDDNLGVNEVVNFIHKQSLFDETEYRLLVSSCSLRKLNLSKKRAQEAVSRVTLDVHRRQWLNKTSCKSRNFKRSVLSQLLEDRSDYCTIPSSGLPSSLAAGGAGGAARSPGRREAPRGLADDDDCQEESELSKVAPLLLNEDEPFHISILPRQNDHLAAAKLKLAYYNDLCRVFDFARSHHPPVFPKISLNFEPLSGAGCKTNSSLSFLALDSIENHHFTESLGININSMPDKTVVVILDNKQESQYVMKDEVTAASIRTFITNYHNNTMVRTLKTAVVNLNNTHHYCSLNIKCTSKCSTDLCITELTSRNFVRFVMEPNKVVIVVHCGGSCEPHTARAMLATSRILKQSKIAMKLGRIDATQHDLPWSYTASKYPAIVVYPPVRKQDSRAYPESQRISSEGVLALVMSLLDPGSNIEIRLLVANQTRNVPARKKYLSDLRLYVATLINGSLRQWRRVTDVRAKNVIMRKLQSMRTISLSLGALNTTVLPADHPVMKPLYEALSSLETLWRLKGLGGDVPEL